ncbi:MAG: class I tRNA ligase family protein, partial [Candidatus Uhrbacteria bacterium]
LETKKGSELIGAVYEPLYPTVEDTRTEKIYSVLSADFVNLEDGTGIVHIAPAYGPEDFDLGKVHNISPIITVSQSGMMDAGFPGAGKFFKDADEDIREDLRTRGLLFRDERITHTYPFCWRCKSPLLTYARSSWYIEMSKLRDRLVAGNQTIAWHPEHIRDGRFGEWLREVKDWAITRERYWGAPLPIWKCDDCDHNEVLGSFSELLAKATKRNRFLIMRHGQALSNAKRIMSLKLETSEQYPLTAEGEQRVRAAAERLKTEGVTKIVASPFHRMRQTAEIVGAAVGVTPEYAHELREMDMPDFDGKPVSDLHQIFATIQERFDKKIGNNETWDELRARVLKYLKQLDEQHEGETILVCTHGDNIWLLRWALAGFTRSGISEIPYPDYDNPQEVPFTGALIDDRGEFDVHRPLIDSVTWPCTEAGCNGTMVRYPEVADVWLESGAMPFAQHHYPFESIPDGLAEADGSPKPAAYIAEGIDQTRGWFYTLHAIATVLGKERAYDHCFALGHLLDADGQKMSKSKGNIVIPSAMIEKYGADVVRWYMLSVNQPWDPKLFDENDLLIMSRKPFGTLLNVLSFHELHGGDAIAWESEHVLDAWLRARTRQTFETATSCLDAYKITEAVRSIGELIDDLSTWWLRRSRDRLKHGDEGAQATLGATLRTIAILLAPFAPFTAEHIWQELRRRGVLGSDGAESVHLAMWESAAPSALQEDAATIPDMQGARSIVSFGLEAREQAKIPVRQALAMLSIQLDLPDAILELVAEELNVKRVVVDKSLEHEVRLDTTLTPE